MLWYVLFNKSDLCSRRYFFDDGASIAVPGLISPRLEATSNFRQRLLALRSWLPKELHAYLEEWDSHISSVTEPYIQLDAADTILLVESDDLAAFHVECIEALETGSLEALVTLFDRAALNFDRQQGRVVSFDSGGVEYSLMGYS